MPDPERVYVDDSGFIVVTDPEIIKTLDVHYHDQKKLGLTDPEKMGLLGIKLKFMAKDDTTAGTEGTHPVDSLCKC